MRQHLFFQHVVDFHVLDGLLLNLLEKLSNLLWSVSKLEIGSRRPGSYFTVFSRGLCHWGSLCSVLCSLSLVKPLKALFLPYKLLLLSSVCLHIPCGNSPWETGVLNRNGCPSYFLSCYSTMVLVSLNF